MTTTNNPLEVSKLLQEDLYHLVITDLKMPMVDGMDLIDIVKKLDPGLPIIIITAYGTIETAEEAIQVKGPTISSPSPSARRPSSSPSGGPWSGSGCKGNWRS